jgi:hypothetical protein
MIAVRKIGDLNTNNMNCSGTLVYNLKLGEFLYQLVWVWSSKYTAFVFSINFKVQRCFVFMLYITHFMHNKQFYFVN